MTRLRLAPLLLALTLAAAACGESAPTESSAPGSTTRAESAADHNQADIEFLQGMIPHHAQAVEMSEMALGRSDDPKIVDLAELIKAAQQPEIDQMNTLLAGWGVEAAGGGHSGSHGSAAVHPGMLDDTGMAALDAAEGDEFERLFLEGMIGHHQGAVTTSQAELEGGQSPEAKELAQMIIDAQEAEIAEMEQLLSEI